MAYFVWGLEGEQAKCFVAATPKVVVTMIKKAKADVPVLQVMYKLDDLQKMGAFFGLMKRRNIVPKVFLINSRSLNPEVLITFGIIGIPSKELVRTYGEDAVDTGIKKDMTIELCSTAATAVHGYVLRRFLGNFSQCREAYVIVTERPTLSTKTGPVDPVQFFLVRGFEHRLPEARLY